MEPVEVWIQVARSTLARERVLRFSIRVKPNARENTLHTVDARGVVTVHVAAPPIEGRANEAVIRVLAEAFDVPRSKVQIVRGHQSKTKVVEIAAFPRSGILT